MPGLTRRDFVSSILVAGFCPPAVITSAADPIDELSLLERALQVEPLIFDVCSHSGELVAANYLPNADRYTAYDVSPDDLRFGEGCYDLLDRIQALRSMIYWFSIEVEGDHEELDDWETDMVHDFIDTLSGENRAELTRQLQVWFAEEPDLEERDSNDIIRPTDGRQLAFRLFWDCDPEVLDALEIFVVEGDHPGSTYYAAEMRGSVDEANRIAEERGMPWRFRRR